ncbi:hypothetical protein [Flavobacterium sp.]|uniref:hypothetical protein n=1 Tax=Flavobacterium sp. TaxID=239 RepID=UPI002B4AD7A0|nr:hypothetical protein [Flavobacterium sp.]HLP64879.1 hypothetical protein [Flavobacterium sp.]
MKKCFLTAFLFLFCFTLTAQVGIGTTSPSDSSMLDVVSTNKGLLVPRVALSLTTSASPIAAPDVSLLVFNTATAGDVTPGYYYWSGTGWVRLQSGNSVDWTTTGNNTTNPAINFIGTTNPVDFVTRTNNTERMRVTSAGNIGMGMTNPAYGLELGSTFGFGNGTSGAYRSRTETRDNAGAFGTSQSGFFEAANPVNFPAGATSWWHLIDTRHSNNANNYALQIAGSFFDQELWFRKTNNSATQSWTRLITTGNMNTNAWTLFGNSGTNASVNFVGTSDAVDFVTRTANLERMRVTSAGNVGIGIAVPAAGARLQVVGGSIMPQTGNNLTSGIYFPPNPGGGGGDEAYIRHYVEAGENTKLVIANVNDSDDDIAFRTGLSAADRININGNGTTAINRAVLFDCNDCGLANAYDITDGAGANWGDLVIQGRVLSTNSNLHLSPPGGSRVIINSAYRSAGGGTGTTGLDIEDGGIRMRKNYRWINRYGSTAGFGWGSQTHNLGAWDFCAVGAFGFRNVNAATDEDDDVQCSVYPNAHADAGEANQWDSFFTYQFNQRPNWFMYLEGFADTTATNCTAICMNFD